METDDDLIKAYRFNSTTVNLLALLAKRDRDDPHVVLAKAGARLVVDQMGVEKSARLINHVIECLQSNPPSCLAPKSSKRSAKTTKKLEAKAASPAAPETKGSSGRSKNGEENRRGFTRMRQSVALARRRAQIERALSVAPKIAAVKAVATTPVAVAAAPAASGSTKLSNRLPDLKIVEYGRAIDTPWGRLTGLSAIWAAGQTQEGKT
jgi:hypothetical protein